MDRLVDAFHSRTKTRPVRRRGHLRCFRAAFETSDVSFEQPCKVGWEASERFWGFDVNAIFGGIIWTKRPITQVVPLKRFFGSRGRHHHGRLQLWTNRERVWTAWPSGAPDPDAQTIVRQYRGMHASSRTYSECLNREYLAAEVGALAACTVLSAFSRRAKPPATDAGQPRARPSSVGVTLANSWRCH